MKILMLDHRSLAMKILRIGFWCFLFVNQRELLEQKKIFAEWMKRVSLFAQGESFPNNQANYLENPKKESK